MEKKRKKFSWRVFVSFGLFYSLFIIFISGIVLYLAPAGRVSNWVNWKLFGFTKENWQSIHTVFSYIFSIFAIFHLFTINWRAFWSYVRSKSREGFNKKREFIYATFLTIIFFITVVFSVPPVSYVMDFGTYLTESWENDTEEAPIPHAELLSLNELSKQLDSISVEQITNRLNANKIKFDNPEQTLEEIGIINNITPLEIYNIIAKKEKTTMITTGLGKKTLEEFAAENNKDLDQLLKILEKNNIKAAGDKTLKDIASDNDMAAKDIYELIK